MAGTLSARLAYAVLLGLAVCLLGAAPVRADDDAGPTGFPPPAAGKKTVDAARERFSAFMGRVEQGKWFEKFNLGTGTRNLSEDERDVVFSRSSAKVNTVSVDVRMNHRQPVDEWVCLESATSVQPHGIGLTESRLWDRRGPIGRSLQSLLLDRH